MNYLVDTNILTRISDPAHAMHQEALDAVTLLVGQALNLAERCRLSSTAQGT